MALLREVWNVDGVAATRKSIQSPNRCSCPIVVVDLSRLYSERKWIPARQGESAKGYNLTNRNIECLIRYIIEADIERTATAMGVAYYTIRHTLDSIRYKLNADSLAHAAALAYREYLPYLPHPREWHRCGLKFPDNTYLLRRTADGRFIGKVLND